MQAMLSGNSSPSPRDASRVSYSGQTALPLSLTLFGVYVDEMEAHLRDNNKTRADDGCVLHHVLIALLLFEDDVVLLASSLASSYDIVNNTSSTALRKMVKLLEARK